MTRRAPALIAAGLVALVAIPLAGCAATPTPSPVATDEPVLENCGFPVTVAAPPQRIVAIKSTSIEMLLALGVGDRIVGTAFSDGPVPEQWADQAAGIPELAPQFPSEEAVLALDPDLVYSGWESAFAPEAAGDRAELASLGVASYVSPAACRSADQPTKLGFDEVFREIAELGAILGVDASGLIDEQKAQLAAIQPDGRGLTALWYSSGDDTPYVGGDIGAPQMVMDAVGLTNIVSGVGQTWTSLDWEAIVDADPDVIVLVDASWNTAASKIARLESDPATAQLSAVKAGRYLVVPFAASEAGVRSVEAATSLAEQLARLDRA
ncbi:MAG: putative F420-0 ABC transporter substrate-binding protein [Actinomycetales bacterium]|nr:putative F420-0 ABC transporter substrate-binding protein [Actinomycetales bacterium]